MSTLKFKPSKSYSVFVVLSVIAIVLTGVPIAKSEIADITTPALRLDGVTDSMLTGVQVTNNSADPTPNRKLEILINDQQDTFDPNVVENSFDMDRFLEEFDNIDCSRRHFECGKGRGF